MDGEVVLRSLQDPQWSDFVAQHRSALPFHHPSWAGMLAECYGFRAFCLTVEDRAGRIVAGLPVIEVGRRRGRTRWISLPFTDECPPLLTGDAGVGLADALDRIRRTRGISRLEVRGDLSGEMTQRSGAYVTHRLALDRSEDEVLGSLHRSQVRRNIRRAHKAGVVVRPGNTETDLTQVFYRLHARTRHRLGVPVQPLRYFRLLWRRVIEPGLGKVMVAELDGTAVAAGVFLASSNVTVYKYGASDERHWSLRPNQVLVWEAIRWAMGQGCQAFDFGRTDVGDVSLRDFKSRWGTVEHDLSYSFLADSAIRAGGPGVPSPLRSVIRHGPQFVPRVLGELLYRHSA